MTKQKTFLHVAVEGLFVAHSMRWLVVMLVCDTKWMKQHKLPVTCVFFTFSANSTFHSFIHTSCSRTTHSPTPVQLKYVCVCAREDHSTFIQFIGCFLALVIVTTSATLYGSVRAQVSFNINCEHQQISCSDTDAHKCVSRIKKK